MRVPAINTYNTTNRRYTNQTAYGQSHYEAQNTPQVRLHVITFGKRYTSQVAEFTPECKGTGLPEMAIGGEGVVGYELGESLNKYETVRGKKVDDRRFMPIWNYNNPNGGHKFLLHKGIKTQDLPDTMPASHFMSGHIGDTKESIAKALGYNVDEIDYVVQSKPNGSNQSKYCIIEPTGVNGVVKCPSTIHLGEMNEVPYQLMRVSENNPKYNTFGKRGNNYFIYTPEWARTSKPYSYDCFGNTPFEAEIINSNGMRAWAEILENKMNTEEFGYFKPANVICHDRPASAFMVHIANMSAQGHKEINGIKAHKVEHNPSRDYQGTTYDPFKMISVVGTEKDMETLRSNPHYSIVEKAFYNGGLDSGALTDREKQIAKNIIEPFVAPFRDYFGSYNITKMPIIGVKRNPDNMSLGSVSWNYDAEMRSLETPDTAKGLTGDYASIKTIPVANGVTTANMRFNERDVQFGRGNNGLSKPENLKGFTPFEYDGTNIEEIIKAKEKNAKWFTTLMYEAGEKGQDALNKLMFDEAQIKEGHEVIGYLSPLKKGEMLALGLGRPDTQKGYPISTGSALHFFKRTDIPKEMKQKVKFFFGIGLMDKNHPHYKMIEKDYKEICELDNGAYKHNIAINRGFTPNRLNACSQFGDYTSLYEMFGITPIEAKAAGSPSVLTATGGFRDYTKDGINGFITKDVVMGAPEKFGLTYANSAEELEKARIDRQIPQMSDNIKKMIELYTNDRKGYIEMCKRNIEEKVDWHNNSEYNHGTSANRRYLDTIFESEKGWDARFKQKMNRLVGEFGEFKDNLEEMVHKTKSRPAKIILLSVIAMLAIGSEIYLYLLHQKNKQKEQTQAAQPEQTQAAQPEQKQAA